MEINERQFQVEAKEFSSGKPAKQLKKELADKIKKVPNIPKQPIVFHVVLVEKGNYDKEREDTFLDAVKEFQGCLPNQISAIVVGKRFIDSKGGRIKRDIDLIIINRDAIAPIDECDLKVVFEANHTEIEYPLYGIGSFPTFDNS